MPTETAAQGYARLATEAADRADALIHGDEIVVRTADGHRVWIGVSEDELLVLDSTGACWPWSTTPSRTTLPSVRPPTTGPSSPTAPTGNLMGSRSSEAQ
jgi:hypothetical protein